MIEAPIDPPDSTAEIKECPCCKNPFVAWSPEFVIETFFAWWDEDEEDPLCSLQCREEYEEEYGWEYEEQEQNLDLEDRLAKLLGDCND